MTNHERLVAAYLESLRAAAADLSPDDRNELVSSISEHIATSLSEMDDPTEADVRNLLERLGEPGTIVADARAQLGTPPTPGSLQALDDGSARAAKPGPLEWGGIVMLGVGSCLLPIIGTVAGLVMVSLSPWWTKRQKVTAAVLSLAGIVLVPLVAASFLLAVRADSGPMTPVIDYRPAPVLSHIPTSPQ